MLRNFSQILCALVVVMAAPIANARPVVLELFTSQGCSSCPPADALLASMENDPAVLPLSLHIDYWDRLGWKDSMSESAMTQRQYGYAAALGKSGVFTPQLIVDGAVSVVGSDETAVEEAIHNAQRQQAVIPLTIAVTANKQLVVQAAAADIGSALPATAEVTAFYFTRHTVTQVERGENAGRTLGSINNVIRIEALAAWHAGEPYRAEIALPVSGNEGVAIIIQCDRQGAILGAISAL